MILIALVLCSIYAGVATATEAAAVGVIGALVLSLLQRTLNWQVFKGSLMGATRMYCMIALILAGAQFLTLSMGYIGLPRALAAWIASLDLSQFQLILALMVFFIFFGCFFDGILNVVIYIGMVFLSVTVTGKIVCVL